MSINRTEQSTCLACGGDVFDPFADCLTCEATAKAINATSNRPVYPNIPEGEHIPTLAERLAHSMKDDRRP